MVLHLQKLLISRHASTSGWLSNGTRQKILLLWHHDRAIGLTDDRHAKLDFYARNKSQQLHDMAEANGADADCPAAGCGFRAGRPCGRL